LRDTIERRVNLFGVSEPIVQVEQGGLFGSEKEQRLIVELPGVTDVNEAIKKIGETPTLEFRLLSKEAQEKITEMLLVMEQVTKTACMGRLKIPMI
jgi:preprotein translocase subunit SecD